MRHTFSVHGRGHRMLSALRDGPKYRSEVIFDAECGYVMHALRRVGAVKHGAGRYIITEFGLDALRQLDAGEEFVTYEGGGNVRVFAQAGAAQC